MYIQLFHIGLDSRSIRGSVILVLFNLNGHAGNSGNNWLLSACVTCNVIGSWLLPVHIHRFRISHLVQASLADCSPSVSANSETWTLGFFLNPLMPYPIFKWLSIISILYSEAEYTNYISENADG